MEIRLHGSKYVLHWNLYWCYVLNHWNICEHFFLVCCMLHIHPCTSLTLYSCFLVSYSFGSIDILSFTANSKHLVYSAMDSLQYHTILVWNRWELVFISYSKLKCAAWNNRNGNWDVVFICKLAIAVVTRNWFVSHKLICIGSENFMLVNVLIVWVHNFALCLWQKWCHHEHSAKMSLGAWC